jgi:hypothetical protein
MENFISLFLRMSYHLKYFKTINETTPKIYNFILEFYNTSDGGKRLAGVLPPCLIVLHYVSLFFTLIFIKVLVFTPPNNKLVY